MPYDPVKDFAPLTLVAASPNVLTVNPDVPARTVQELIALVKANPGKYSFAQPATGSTPHLNGELFKLAFGLDLAMVPFNGAAPAVTSTIGMVATSPHVLVIPNKLRASKVEDLVRLARANPCKLSYASAGAFEAFSTTPEAAGKFIASEAQRLAKLIKTRGITAN